MAFLKEKRTWECVKVLWKEVLKAFVTEKNALDVMSMVILRDWREKVELKDL